MLRIVVRSSTCRWSHTIRSLSTSSSRSHAFKIHDFRTKPKNKLMISCEHAKNSLRPPFQWLEEDTHLQDSHWASDPGANDFSVEFAKMCNTIAVCSTFSRLLIDPNRPISSISLVRSECDGHQVKMNQDLTQEDLEYRIWKYYIPYHLELGRCANEVDPELIVSVHTFSPKYEDDVRDFEIGVLCTFDESLCTRICDGLQEDGFDTRINEPWSGKEGFMYSADSLAIAQPNRRRSIMLELRNDLAVDSEWRNRVKTSLYRALKLENLA